MSAIYRTDSTGNDLVAAAEAIAKEFAAPHAAEVDRAGRFPQEALQALADGGFWGLCTPKEFGGHEQPPAVFAAVVETLGQVCSSTAMVYVMHVVAAQALAASGTLAGRDALLRQIAAGRHLTTLAFSERGSRSQFWAPVSQLSPEDEGYVTTAAKSWVTSANYAGSYVSSAQKPGAASPLESTLYLVRRKAKGVAVAAPFDGLGLRGNDSAPVSMENLTVAEGDLLTAHGAGAAMMLEVVLPWFCVGTAALAHGLCLAAISATRQHLSSASFEHNGSQLRDLPNLRTRLAEMSVCTEQSRALLGHTAQSMLEPDEGLPLLILQSRLAALEAAIKVTDLAMKACGGAAFSRHLRVEQLFRDARAGWVMAPTVDHLQEFIGRALTGLPLFQAS
jgi:alkylation response protein AidB-like acyl-CoA dehydrogenase